MPPQREIALAGLVPLWRTLNERSVTALVTPALDYVGCLELSGVSIAYENEAFIGSTGETLRSFVASLEDECNLLFLYVVDDNCDADIRAYDEASAKAHLPQLREYALSRKEWLQARPMRRARCFLFFSLKGPSLSTMVRGFLGMKLLFGKLAKDAQARHDKNLEALGLFRDRLASRLAAAGVSCSEMSVEAVRQLHYELLNPNRRRQRLTCPRISVRQSLFDADAIAEHGESLAEYSEAEQLVFESIEDGRGHFRQGATFRRACSLKVMPESGTFRGDAERLLNLRMRTRAGALQPFGYVLSVAVSVKPQGRTKFMLDKRHGLVDGLRRAIPFLSGGSIGKAVKERAQQNDIEALFQELNQMSAKIVDLSVTLLLEATSYEELEAQTEAASTAFNTIGNAELVVEDVAQLPVFLGVLPGSAPYQVRRKSCTSRNAGDLLPVFMPWRGTREAVSLFTTPDGDPFRFDPFDMRLSSAHHGLVIADTGSGKSVTMGAFTLDAHARGHDAILIDNGGSWRRLTELFGGSYVAVDLKTSICPFVSYAEMVDEASGEVDPENVQDVVKFIEVCVTDSAFTEFDKEVAPLVGRAVRQAYEALRGHPDVKPLMSNFRDVLVAFAKDEALPSRNREIAQMLVRRLEDFCDGTYRHLVNEPSKLDFSSRLLTFDMAGVSKSKTTKELAMATVFQAIGNRTMKAWKTTGRRTLVEVDEGHEYLRGGSDESFLAACYRKYRKYGTAMWMISQQFADFQKASCGPAIIGNSKLKIFLYHERGNRQAVTDYFKMPPRVADAFDNLRFAPGYYSDLLLMYGARTAAVRMALHPLALWVLTTDPEDRDLYNRAAKKNPGLSEFELLKQLAAHYPHGARGVPARRVA